MHLVIFNTIQQKDIKVAKRDISTTDDIQPKISNKDFPR